MGRCIPGIAIDKGATGFIMKECMLIICKWRGFMAVVWGGIDGNCIGLFFDEDDTGSDELGIFSDLEDDVEVTLAAFVLGLDLVGDVSSDVKFDEILDEAVAAVRFKCLRLFVVQFSCSFFTDTTSFPLLSILIIGEIFLDFVGISFFSIGSFLS